MCSRSPQIPCSSPRTILHILLCRTIDINLSLFYFLHKRHIHRSTNDDTRRIESTPLKLSAQRADIVKNFQVEIDEPPGTNSYLCVRPICMRYAIFQVSLDVCNFKEVPQKWAWIGYIDDYFKETFESGGY
ncbi:hypothetical protein M413DRAFT_315586 [Hebeloma cylindrosporum]|uniref:Uncharacterized protein n=1 Tax=Hebeloma cylindrosporum TaxID=76867 RepID=A0A0C3CCG8_HEBCY|nr:hypothetical protein M413DRAFT_315586 [Hebeloma cylindrosporum h7]